MLTNTVIQSTLPAFIELFVIDLTRIGGEVHRLTAGQAVMFGGKEYSTYPIKMTGVNRSSDGTPTRPQLEIDNLTRLLLAEVITLGDLVGAQVTRIRTFEKYLDDGESPDPSSSLVETYYINQKTNHTPSSITFELVDALELTDGQLPNIQATNKIFPALGRMGY